MALIMCPECGKEISNKAKKCPNCAYSLKKHKLNFKEHKKIIIISLLVLILIIGGLIGFYIYSKKEYSKKINLLSFQMLGSSADCEKLADLTSNVWYNTIYEKSDKETNKYTIRSNYYKDYLPYYNYKDYQFNNDFNTSLNNLFVDKADEVSKINQEAEDIKNQVKDLKNAPLGQKDIYNALIDFNNAYQELVNLATNPSGSYTEYTKNKNEKIENGLNAYERLSTLLPIN